MNGGSAGSGGYTYQHRVGAYVAVHILAQRPLNWLHLHETDTPIAVSAETGGP